MRIDTFIGIRIQQSELKITNTTIDLLNDKLSRLKEIEASHDVDHEIQRLTNSIRVFTSIKANQEKQFQETMQELQTIMESSNDIESKCLVLRFVEGKKYSEIEQQLNYSEVHIKRICGRLSKRIELMDITT